jgi:crotonobetainyl-CoA:carnitine CoA-transferase CaiB-like acyl-CoA transferase
MISQTGVSITRYAMSRELPWQAKNKYIGLSTFGMFEAEDGWVYIAADPQMIERINKAMDIESLETTEQLREWVSDKKVDFIVEKLVAEQVPVAPILHIDQTLEDPHVQARGIISSFEHPTSGNVRSPGFPVKLSKTPGTMRLPAPQLGEHNLEILTKLLGYAEDDVMDLKKKGIIS